MAFNPALYQTPAYRTPAPMLSRPSPVPMPVPTPTGRPNNSGVPGLSSNSSLSNISFNTPTPVNINQAIKSGGLTPQNQGQVLGAQAPVGGSGGNSGGGNSGGNQGQQNAISGLQDAELASLNTEFERNLADLDAQLRGVYSQRDEALGGLETAQNQLLSDIDAKKQGVEKSKLSMIDEAASTARTSQRSNRNVLRSLGILNSTYAADKLQEPTLGFEKARADIGIQATDRIKELDDLALNKKSEFVQQYKSLSSQFGQIVDNINRDMRFTDRQRADSIKAVNAAYAAKLADLKTSTQGVVDQAAKAKQAFIASNLSNILNADPAILSNPALLNQYFANSQDLAGRIYGPQQVGITDPRKKLLTDTFTGYGASSPTGPVNFNFGQ